MEDEQFLKQLKRREGKIEKPGYFSVVVIS
jgi:hypothetical protein